MIKNITYYNIKYTNRIYLNINDNNIILMLQYKIIKITLSFIFVTTNIMIDYLNLSKSLSCDMEALRARFRSRLPKL